MKTFIVNYTISLVITFAGIHLLLTYETRDAFIFGLMALTIGGFLTAIVLIYRKELRDNSNSSG